MRKRVVPTHEKKGLIGILEGERERVDDIRIIVGRAFATCNDFLRPVRCAFNGKAKLFLKRNRGDVIERLEKYVVGGERAEQ